MKKFLMLFGILLILGSCNSPNNKKVNSTSPTKEESTSKIFFDYDKIDYYTIDSRTDIDSLYNKQFQSKIDSFKFEVVLGDIPKSISDTSFIDMLSEMGFKKYSIDKSMFPAIDKIFSEKPTKLIVTMPCIYNYWDIIIFKKNERINGTVKVDVGCWAYQMHGTKVNTESFGREQDYEELKKFLRNFKQ